MEATVEDIPQADDVHSSPAPAQGAPSVAHLSIAKTFHVENPNREEEGKLLEIWEYGKKMSKIGDTSDIIWQINRLQHRLGPPRLGEMSIDKVYRWAKLKRQESQIQEELRRI